MNATEQATKNWMLARLRTVRTGLQLVVAHVDSIGGDLASDKISAREAAYDLTVLEEAPVYWLGHILTPVDDEEILAPSLRDAPPIAPSKPRERTYRTPEMTEQAFWYVAKNEPAELEQWLANHPKDAAHLRELWEGKCRQSKQ